MIHLKLRLKFLPCASSEKFIYILVLTESSSSGVINDNPWSLTLQMVIGILKPSLSRIIHTMRFYVRGSMVYTLITIFLLESKSITVALNEKGAIRIYPGLEDTIVVGIS